MIHLYALGCAPLGAGSRGIDASPVTTIATGGIHAVVSHHDEAVRPSTEAALQHVATIEAVAERIDVAPVRFGRGHVDAAALRTKLDASLPELRDLLGRVAGHVEFVVRSSGVPVEDPRPTEVGPRIAAMGAGRAYLEGRRASALAAADERRRIQDRLVESTGPLDEHAVATHDTIGPHGPERCFLVRRDAARSFTSRARLLVGTDGSMVIGGPWPPFSFAPLPVPAEVAR